MKDEVGPSIARSVPYHSDQATSRFNPIARGGLPLVVRDTEMRKKTAHPLDIRRFLTSLLYTLLVVKFLTEPLLQPRRLSRS